MFDGGAGDYSTPCDRYPATTLLRAPPPPTSMSRAAVDVEDLLKLVLVLVLVWLALEIVGEVFDVFFGLLGFLPNILGLVVVVLIVLWLLDRI
jgi:hypothetical protein